MQDFYLVGYKLLIPTQRYKHMDANIVPDYFISASECISNILVNGDNIMNTANEYNDKTLQHYKNVTKLNASDIDILNRDIDRYFKLNKFGFDGSFSDKNTAIEIYKKHFAHLDNVKLISLGLNDEELKCVIEGKNYNYGTVLYSYINNKSIINEGRLLGYEVLGGEFGYSIFHSMFCSGSEKDVYSKFGHKLNEYGLFDEYQHALDASIYIYEEDLGEPVVYQPFAIFENELE